MRAKLTFRLDWKHLITLPLIMAVFWVFTLILPDDFRIEDVGSLIVVSALYYILLVLVLLVILMIGICMRRQSLAIVTAIFVSFIAGAPILLLLNGITNGFWISDFWVALTVSIVTSMVLIGYEVAICRE